MKKTNMILITLLLVLALLIMGCEKEEDVTEPVKPTSEDFCNSKEGNWIPAAMECEYISKANCAEMGGTFNECGSACRNDPNAEICTMQCVPFCSFS